MSTNPRRCSVQGTPCSLSLILAIEAIMGVVEKSSFRDSKEVLTLAEFSCSFKHFMDLNCHQNPDCHHFNAVHPLPCQVHYYFC